MSHRFDPTVLREYDIRGIVGKTLTPADAKAVGLSFGTYVRRHGGKTIAVGYDGRLSSPVLEAEVVAGLVATGLQVTRIGIGPTPMLYFATRHLHTDAGLMITGSHNPPDYNGFKMVLGKAPIYGQTIQELGALAAAGDFATGAALPVATADVRATYVERLAQDYVAPRGLKVAWDAGNGAAGEILQALVKKLPGEHHVIYADIDGRFPNHHPDPTVAENLRDLQKLVRDKGCDLGIGFDGDGDRIGAIDAAGRIVPGDMLLAIYAGEVLATHPGATIVADVKSSQVLFNEVKRLGGNPIMWKTGHSLLKAKMAETGSPLSGEISGHIMFADKYYGFDDALYCAVRLINLLANGHASLGQLFDRLPQVVNTPEIRVQVDESRKFAVIDEIRTRLRSGKNDVNEIDGVRVNTNDGWWLLRASNTQDVIVARAEAFKPDGLNRLTQAIADQLAQSGVHNFDANASGGH